MSLLKLEHLLRFGFNVSATGAYLEIFFSRISSAWALTLLPALQDPCYALLGKSESESLGVTLDSWS